MAQIIQTNKSLPKAKKIGKQLGCTRSLFFVLFRAKEVGKKRGEFQNPVKIVHIQLIVKNFPSSFEV